MASASIRQDGVDEYAAGVRRLADDIDDVALDALDAFARAAAQLGSRRFPTLTGAAASSVRAEITGDMAQVAMGGGRAPHAGVRDWGGPTGRPKRVRVPYRSGGRFVLPAIRELERAELAKMGDAALEAAADRAGLL